MCTVSGNGVQWANLWSTSRRAATCVHVERPREKRKQLRATAVPRSLMAERAALLRLHMPLSEGCAVVDCGLVRQGVRGVNLHL